eukprot:352152-Chlamydomonas_euryale.AAC.2
MTAGPGGGGRPARRGVQRGQTHGQGKGRCLVMPDARHQNRETICSVATLPATSADGHAHHAARKTSGRRSLQLRATICSLTRDADAGSCHQLQTKRPVLFKPGQTVQVRSKVGARSPSRQLYGCVSQLANRHDVKTSLLRRRELIAQAHMLLVDSIACSTHVAGKGVMHGFACTSRLDWRHAKRHALEHLGHKAEQEEANHDAEVDAADGRDDAAAGSDAEPLRPQQTDALSLHASQQQHRERGTKLAHTRVNTKSARQLAKGRAEQGWAPLLEHCMRGAGAFVAVVMVWMSNRDGAVSNIPNHDGTDVFKWDDTLQGHEAHFRCGEGLGSAEQSCRICCLHCFSVALLRNATSPLLLLLLLPRCGLLFLVLRETGQGGYPQPTAAPCSPEHAEEGVGEQAERGERLAVPVDVAEPRQQHAHGQQHAVDLRNTVWHRSVVRAGK